MLESIVLMGGLGITMGAVLAVASKTFYVYEDPKVVAITDVLPGANCGGCGLPGCGANAEAVVRGEADVNSCVAAGEDVALAIAEIMGVSMTEKEPEFADLGCYYNLENSDIDYRYAGVSDCRAAVMLFGGMKTCRIGCLGLGTCVRACMFGALKIGTDGLPEVDVEKCTGCGACERICPKGIIRLTSVTRRIMREYTLNDCVTPCQRACPTGIDIREYIRLIKKGDYKQSLMVIKERNPFPTVISRICPAPCEMNCRRLIQDESVAINQLKRFVCDYDMSGSDRAVPYKAPASSKRVAVVGGGVEGLSTAYFSARLGHDVTVFEGTDKMGGILLKAISRKRLQMDILEWDIQGVAAMGVDMKTGMKAGRDFSIWDLLAQGYDAVFTATGGWDSRLSRNEADDVTSVIPGTWLLIDLLRSETRNVLKGKLGARAVIAGGESSALEAVECLHKAGVKEITLVSRKAPGQSMDEDMLKKLSGQGVTIIQRAGITRMTGTKDRLTGLECMDLETGETKHIVTDTLLLASGRFPELVFSIRHEKETTDLQSDPGYIPPMETQEDWQAVELVKPPENRQEIGLLSPHDVISEYHSVVAAINGGRKAAAAIHHVVHEIPFQDTSNLITRYSVLQDVDKLELVPVVPRHVVGAKTGSDQPDGQGFSEETALQEAGRCLRCGLLCYENETEN